ncbi:Uncharacterized protein FWK35_00034128 [Aphis craccivora]|uniref:Uncharacterized protein n=1 Tax=Aphis craccivora TaxID=307492 RepID=A0A6G0W3X9_APHCR|nr:Uncharacterized protein FWK35_00034128 [Aphis craccivora]
MSVPILLLWIITIKSMIRVAYTSGSQPTSRNCYQPYKNWTHFGCTLFSNQQRPSTYTQYNLCQTRVTIKHILEKCPIYKPTPTSPHNIKETLDEGQTSNIIKSITKYNLINKI